MFKLKSIRTKLLLVFLLGAVLPFGIFGVLNIQNSKADLEKEIGNKLSILADAKEGQVFAYLDSLEGRTMDFSSDGFIRDSLKEITGKNSQQAVRTLNEHLVKNKKVLDPTLAGILILDLKGKVVASTDERVIGDDESANDYFVDGQKGVFITEVREKGGHFGIDNPIVVATPLTDMTTGGSLGVLVNFFDAGKIQNILSGQFQLEKGALIMETGQVKTLEVYLVNREKKMFIHPQRSEHKHTSEMLNDTAPVRLCLENQKEMTGKYLNYNGEEVIGASMCFVSRKWVLLAEIPIREAFAPIVQMQTRFGVTIGGFGILLILIAFFSANTLTGPIKKLHKATEVITAGNLGFRVEIKTGDEIEQLSHAFNEMAGKLQESYAGLEGKVKERTEELAVKLAELQKSNTSLGSTEKAMLNILEDARGLEEALKVEKAGVEKKVEERTYQLREEQSKLKASIDSLNVGFFLVDSALEIMIINPVAKRLLCYSDNHSHPVGVVTSQDNLNVQCQMQDIEKELQEVFDLRASLQKSIAEKKPIEIKELEFKNRTMRIFMSPIVIIENIEIKTIGAVVLVEDITEAKILERSKDEFFSIASHELRTPLTAIRGNTALIEQYYAKDLKEPELKSMISDINESAVRLISIVNDFLDVSRLEMGKLEYKTAQIDLVALTKNTIQEYMTTGSIKNLYVRMEEPKEPVPAVFADADRIKQVLINLIGNAIKFTEKGGVTVKLENIPDFVKISVMDTGKGIPEENQKLLFRRFQQAGSSLYTRDATKGTGLGLYISKMIIEGMGGKIGLESSDPQKGSVFSFTLPIKPVSSPSTSQILTPKIPQTKQSTPSNGQNLAVIGSVR